MTDIHFSNLFDSAAQTITNPVNLMGVSGAGLARQFKQRYPEPVRQYEALCKTGQFKMGQLWTCQTTSNRQILFFPTKTDWRQPSSIEYIEAGLKNLARTFEQREITSLALPALGCGPGKLWLCDILLAIDYHLDPLPIPSSTHLYHPNQSDPRKRQVTCPICGQPNRDGDAGLCGPCWDEMSSYEQAKRFGL